MKTRIITAAVLLAIFVPILFFSDTVVYPIALSILCIVGIGELLQCVLPDKKKVSVLLPSALFGLFPLAAFFFTGKIESFLTVLLLSAFLLAVYLFAVCVFTEGSFSYKNAATVFMGVVYLSLAFSALTLLRYIENGVYWFLLPYLGAWMTDTFAYFTGRFFGKHKLSPIISPKKTVEGSLGGILFCIGAFAAYGAIVASGGALRANYLALILCALFVSLVSQIGDLSLSAIKREYGIKDYGKIFPGHGGVLDRFDSVVATAPLFLILTLAGSGLQLFI